ncbi:phospholipase C [Crossiella equi]|uniref:phospholipase C n=1 Tax=Crossiella equi TaxID=130796 RepID=A0ABS5ACG5_9PSEU|nr:phospholipase C, phosphocholine-specific [Crossiella equi]MBP2474277.1 phospholipase C [Crossiella equi]
MTVSRRQVLTAAVATAGAAALGSLLPPSVLAAIARPAPSGGLRGLRHVVVLMQENRSFDHYYGSLRGVRGFGDRNALELPGGASVFAQPRAGAEPVLPFSVRQAARDSQRPGEAVHYIGDLDHDWDGGHQAWGQGRLDGWIAAKSPATMAYYDRTDLPFHYELADTFTLCDAYHCSVFGATNPNRMYLMSGTVGFEPPPNATRRAVRNWAYAEDTHAGYDWTTYPERLEAAGKSWKVYQEYDNFQDNALEFFQRFKAIARKALLPAGGFKSLDTFYGKVRDAEPAERQRLLDLLAQGVATLTPAERALYDKGLHREPEGGLVAALRADIAAGTLPRVSWLVPSALDSEHPGASSPAASAGITYQVLDALASDPETWAHTALIINYDENDGYFDHVPPPVPPPGTADELVDGQPIGLGFRVPATIVSPWTVGGHVNSQVFDHTSVIRFLETWLGVREPNISAWRRTACGDLTSVFDFGTGRPSRVPPEPARTPPAMSRWRPAAPAKASMPVPEPGTRPSRALPYQPDAWAVLDATRSHLLLDLANTGEASAHFSLHAYAGEFAVPRQYDVLGTRQDAVALPGADYRLTLLGPNGFRREFGGSRSSAAEVRTEVAGIARLLRITLRNNGNTPLTFDLAGRRVRVSPRGSRVVHHSAAADGGWYDLTVRVLGEGSFLRRLAGRVENGRHGVGQG